MLSGLEIAAFIAAAIILWLVYARVRFLSLRWGKGLSPTALAYRASKYLKRYGIVSHVLLLEKRTGNNSGGGPVNLRIPNDQFREKIFRIKFLCRDNSFICGESFFRDIQEMRMKNQDWKSIFVVLTNSPVERENRVLGELYNVAVIHTTELRELAETLVQIKNQAAPTYHGSSTVLAAVLAPAS